MTKINTRQDIHVLPNSNLDHKIDFVIYEIPFGMDEAEYWKKVLPEKEFKEWESNSNYKKGQETDEADKYRDSQGKSCNELENYGYYNIPILDFLKGQPWNNLALNYVMSVNPTLIRVSSSGLTADSHHGRVTVSLEKDNKTIHSIHQEAKVGLMGARNGYDLSKQLTYQKKYGHMTGYDQTDNHVYINDYAIKEIDFKEKND